MGIDTRLVQATQDAPTLFSVCFQYPDGAGGNITTSNSAASALSKSDADGIADLLKSGGKQVIALAVPEVAARSAPALPAIGHAGRSLSGCIFRACGNWTCETSGSISKCSTSCHSTKPKQENLSAPHFLCTDQDAFVVKCQGFLRRSCPNLRMVVSLGKDGAYGVTSDSWNYCPAPDVEVASTAGAGDALLGGIIAALAAGIPFLQAESSEWTPAPIETALELGVLLASYKCLSPHTIHPSACIETLIRLWRRSRSSFFSTAAGTPDKPRAGIVDELRIYRLCGFRLGSGSVRAAAVS